MKTHAYNPAYLKLCTNTPHTAAAAAGSFSFTLCLYGFNLFQVLCSGEIMWYLASCGWLNILQVHPCCHNSGLNCAKETSSLSPSLALVYVTSAERHAASSSDSLFLGS